MSRANIAVIGAGASGLMAGAAAARFLRKNGKNGRVTVIDGNNKAGRKLLATGNGRCNLSNTNVNASRYHGDNFCIEDFLSEYSCERILGEFSDMGLICQGDSEGRVYPVNFQAAAVLRTLLFACEESGVEFILGSPVLKAEKLGEGFVLKLEDGREITAEKCILASGGLASPALSCSDNGYDISKNLGHSVVFCRPSLVSVKSDPKRLKSLKGMRCKASAALIRNGKKVASEKGEVIFSDDAISGICIFDLSAYIAGLMSPARGNEDISDMRLSLDIVQNMTEKELLTYLRTLQRNHPGMKAWDLLSGIVNMRVGTEIVRALGIGNTRTVGELSFDEIKDICKNCKDFSFPVYGLSDFANAQITAGGIPLKEVKLPDMESVKCSGLYLAGEILNIHGDCGGFNLHWAWATGLSAGNAAAQAVLYEAGI